MKMKNEIKSIINQNNKEMKTYDKFLTIILAVLMSLPVLGQQRDLQYFRDPGQRGINVFETSKLDTIGFDQLKVRVGGAFAIQYQSLSHSNSATFLDDGEGNNMNELVGIGSDFNLPTANLDIDVQLARGVRMNLRTYLSSRHHTEVWVKDGYIQIDRLDFIKDGFANRLMDMATFKVGHMEINYGDAHFRRSDNARAIYNPFVGNYILDAFSTEVAGEFYLQKNGIIGMLGISNGKLNQGVTNSGSTTPAFYGKIGYDKQLNNDLRIRLTGSAYYQDKASSIYLYSGDRAGSRYYTVMQSVTDESDNFTSGRWNPNYGDKITAIMVNPFVKWNGWELFGTFETSTGADYKGSDENRTWNQFATDLIYRFGPNDNIYVGARYNTASGKLSNIDIDKVTINRTQVGFGWFMTNNILAKIEYVNQTYNDYVVDSKYQNGRFNGIMVEAAISF